jgi:hypothetical protein
VAGHDITMSARLGPQNAKTVLGIMVRDAFDETGKNLLRLIFRRAFHGRCGRIASCTHAILLKPATWRQLRRKATLSNVASTSHSDHVRESHPEQRVRTLCDCRRARQARTFDFRYRNHLHLG